MDGPSRGQRIVIKAWRFKSLFINATLVLGSSLLTYFVVEAAIFRLLLPIIPIEARAQLSEIADVLTQNSKSDFLPRNYLALLGDSYAEGLGDWLWQTRGNRAAPFHSANVIHDLTGRDVVSFGRGAAPHPSPTNIPAPPPPPHPPSSLFP